MTDKNWGECNHYVVADNGLCLRCGFNTLGLTQKELKNKYQVKIYEFPFVYEVEAKDKAEAEVIAVNKHNSADWDEISKVEVKKVK